MKTRAKTLLTLTASALTLLAPVASMAAGTSAPFHAPAPDDPEKADTLVYSATKSLIESFGELSKTASKLSETALKLLEAQEKLDAKKAANTQSASQEQDASSQTIPAEETDFSESQVSITETPNGDSEVETEEKVSSESIWILPEENQEGGQYLWIPDNNVPTVKAILNGEPISAGLTKPAIDLNEKTFWRGDSILMAIPTKRLGRYDRKLYNWLIYPKGLWHIGLSANYGELSTEDSEFLSLIQDVDLSGKIYSIKPSVSYFLRNNLCVGLRLAFTKGEMGINSFNVDIDDDMSFNLHDIKYSSDSYAAAVFIQQYFGLSRRGRFAVYNEAELSVGTGSSHFIRPFDGSLRDTRTKTQSFNINYSPGVSIMIMKNAAFNLSFGVFGFHLKNEKQWENGEESGNRFTSGINFRFNIFNINFGVAIII